MELNTVISIVAPVLSAVLTYLATRRGALASAEAKFRETYLSELDKLRGENAECNRRYYRLCNALIDQGIKIPVEAMPESDTDTEK